MTNAARQVDAIRTEQDYNLALARLAQLMGSTPGSPQGDELEALATLLDAHETKHFPIDAPNAKNPASQKRNPPRRIQHP